MSKCQQQCFGISHPDPNYTLDCEETLYRRLGRNQLRIAMFSAVDPRRCGGAGHGIIDFVVEALGPSTA